MDWANYKAQCDQPDMWSWWMLHQCAELFAQQGAEDLSQKLHLALANEPLPVPAGFRAGAELRMYRLDLPLIDRQQGLELVQKALAEGLTTAATAKRGLGGFSEAWAEYLREGRA